jgi:hypothetical protein
MMLHKRSLVYMSFPIPSLYSVHGFYSQLLNNSGPIDTIRSAVYT